MRYAWVEYRYHPETVKTLRERVKNLPPDARPWERWAPRSPVVFEEVWFRSDAALEQAKFDAAYAVRETYEKVQHAHYVYVHFDDGALVVYKDPHDAPHNTTVPLS